MVLNIRAKILKEMYMSVDRMHEHIMNGNTDGVQAEKWQQRNLRNVFKTVRDDDETVERSTDSLK